MLRFTTIHHDVRERFNLTISEYMVVDSIMQQTKYQEACKQGPVEMGKWLGIDERTVRRAKTRCVEIGLLCIVSDGYIATDKFIDAIRFAKVTEDKMSETDKMSEKTDKMSKDTIYINKESNTNISAKCSERPTRTYLPVDDDGGIAKQPAKQTAPPLANMLIEVLKKEQGLKHLDGGNNIRAASDVARKFSDECDTRFQSHNETDEYYADQFGVMLRAVFAKDSYFKSNATSMRFINNNLIKMINSVL